MLRLIFGPRDDVARKTGIRVVDTDLGSDDQRGRHPSVGDGLEKTRQRVPDIRFRGLPGNEGRDVRDSLTEKIIETRAHRIRTGLPVVDQDLYWMQRHLPPNPSMAATSKEVTYRISKF